MRAVLPLYSSTDTTVYWLKVASLLVFFALEYTFMEEDLTNAEKVSATADGSGNNNSAIASNTVKLL